MAIIAIINVVNFYLDQHDVVEHPALEPYISETMRKAKWTSVWRCVLTILVS